MLPVYRAGVPVVSLLGRQLASRAGSSLTAAIGCAEGMAPTIKDYELTTVGLGRATGRMSHWRRKVEANRSVAARRVELCSAQPWCGMPATTGQVDMWVLVRHL